MERRKVVRTVLLMAVFVVFGAAVSAASRADRGDGTWGHDFLVSLLAVALMALPVLAVMLWAQRPRPDGMPPEVWAPVDGSRAAGPLRFETSAAYRAGVPVLFAVWLVGLPFLLYRGVGDHGPRAFGFAPFFLVFYGMVVRSWMRTAATLTLDGAVLHATGPWPAHHRWDLPVADLRAVTCPRLGNAVTIAYDGGELPVPKQLRHLDELVVELRRRNAALRYEGAWPPA